MAPELIAPKHNLIAPKHILDIAFAFRRSKALLAAVDLGLFAVLAEGPLEAVPLASRLGIHWRAARDFFDSLVALGLVTRDDAGRYASTPESAQFLDPARDDYMGDALQRVSSRVYGNWNSLAAALRSGQAQSGAFGSGGYGALYADGDELETFLRAMTASSLPFARALAALFPWGECRSIVDIGTAEGCVPMHVLRAFPHLVGWGFDLPAVEPWFTRYVERHGLSRRLPFCAGDFRQDLFPTADVIVMGRVLHNWSLATKRMLLSKAHAALPRGGRVIICETVIDDARRAASDALLASLHMLIETPEGYEATAAEYTAWLEAAGFRDVRIQALGCAQSAISGIK